MQTTKQPGLGWIRDRPDFRDYTVTQAEVKDILAASKPLKAVTATMPKTADLREWCSDIEDQEYLGSCTAQAGVGLLEYYQLRTGSKHIEASRLFLYKVTRTLLGWTGDTGAFLRDTMKAMVLFGAPPERYWPYYTSMFDDEPPAFCYAFAQHYRTLRYYRHDPPGTTSAALLQSVKKHIAAGLPSMFGFTVYNSIPFGSGNGNIPYPSPSDYVIGGHAVVAVGYDDNHRVGNQKGALLIRNSWGPNWGDAGYGWLPYKYVETGLAVDFWSLLEAGWVDTDLFA